MSSTLAFYKRQFFVTPKVADADSHNLQSQTGLVTGSNVGLGYEVSRHPLRLGLSKLILAVRSTERGENARKQLAFTYPSAEILVWEVDLDSYESIQRFVQRCDTLSRLDFAVLNAGVVKLRYENNPTTNHEETIQVNYLSTCLLASLLLLVVDAKSSGVGKITIVGSEVAEWAAFPQKKNDPVLPSLDSPEGYDPGERYYVSKLLPEFYVKKAAKRVDPNRIILNIVNPGFCYGSGLHRELPFPLNLLFGGYKRLVGRTCEVGSRPIVNAAVVQGKGSHGEYFSDNGITP